MNSRQHDQLSVGLMAQPRSQGLSSYRPGGKMRDTGNEVVDGSAGRVLHRYCRGHGFGSRLSLNFFKL